MAKLYAASPFSDDGSDVPMMDTRTFDTETEALTYAADMLTRGAAHVGIYERGEEFGSEWSRIGWHTRTPDDARTAPRPVPAPLAALRAYSATRPAIAAIETSPDGLTRRADGRFDVADTREANEAHGCTGDTECILSDGHPGAHAFDRD